METEESLLQFKSLILSARSQSKDFKQGQEREVVTSPPGTASLLHVTAPALSPHLSAPCLRHDVPLSVPH
jgi:hypothetical protein